MRLTFTGHRNKKVDELALQQIAKQYPDATWIHGGADGFDTQVKTFAALQGIATEERLPDYQHYKRGAPIVRNQEMVNDADMVIACYDGRTTGGTAQTINYARKSGKHVVILSPLACH